MLNLLKKRRLAPLAQTQKDFENQAVDFLLEYGFDVTPDTLRQVGEYISHLPGDRDTVDLEDMAVHIRRRTAQKWAFFLVNPANKDNPKNAPEEVLPETHDETKD